MSVPFNPALDRILVDDEKAVVEEKTAGGIIIPDAAKDKDPERPCRGVVVAIHPQSQWKVGETVVYSQHAGRPIDVYGAKYLLMREGEVDGALLPEPKSLSLDS